MIQALIKLVFLAAFFNFSEAIRCYACDSRTNPTCKDPINLYKLDLAECTPEMLKTSSVVLSHAFNGIRSLEESHAFELLAGASYEDIRFSHDHMHCQKISFYLHGHPVIIRGCQTNLRDKTGDTRSACTILEDHIGTEHDSYMQFCETCKQNGCNSAPGLQNPPPTAIFLLPLMLSAIVSFQR